MSSPWDLTALVNAADARVPQADRHLWLVRLMEWLRHPPARREPAPDRDDGAPAEARTPLPLLRLRLLLKVIDQHPEVRAQVQGMVAAFWREVDAAALFADHGFGSRLSLRSDLVARLRRRLLPGTPQTADLAALFELLFDPADLSWLQLLDAPTLARVAELLATPDATWRGHLLEAMTILVSAVHASGYTPALRQRMDRSLLATEPFRELTQTSNALRHALTAGQREQVLQQALLLRANLAACRQAAASVSGHLETYGVSVDVVYEVDQLITRADRIELLLDCLLAPEPQPELLRLLQELVRVSGRQRGIRHVLARHYSLLARQVAERNAETGTHYITRDRAEYREMLRRAAGGGAVIAGTVFVKFAVLAIGLSAFWSGFWAGVNYAVSFLIVMLLHWTVATKQPAMTAPALAASLPRGEGNDQATLEVFVDRVAQIIRSQVAGIVGNLAAVAPLVLLVQVLARALFGVPLVGQHEAEHTLETLTLLGPTALFAAFTGVLLFASSLIAGWAENWFVFHRLDSAIAWNPRIVARLGAARAQRWAQWWRLNVSGVAANVSLGMMLGLTPSLLEFVGLPIEVRHVTLSTGQLAAALGALGTAALQQGAFWWCVAAIPVTGVLNVGVSFWLAFKVALRSRAIQVQERSRIHAAIRRRLVKRPLDFLLPPR
ncbi:MAG: site-specific recombinase [Proteobacteria bacterium]|nr:site-specific recombinase [Pseudomonadota bacterium]